MKTENWKIVRLGDVCENQAEDSLFENIAKLIENSRKQVAKAVNTAMVYTYYGVGQYIVEYEQDGKNRAGYGNETLKNLSARLTDVYGKGWSYETLAKCRKFYSVYSILSDGQTNSDPQFSLSWNHYQILMRIENNDERKFYEIEAKAQNWGYKWLQRQVASSLYERLALSRNKNEVMQLAEKGQI